MRVQMALFAGFLLLGACGPFGVEDREPEVVVTPAAASTEPPMRTTTPEPESDAGTDAGSSHEDAGTNDTSDADAGAAPPKKDDTCFLIICVGH